MKLNVKDGRLSWGSVFKLALAGSATITLAFVAVIFAFAIIALLAGLALGGEAAGMNVANIVVLIPAFAIYAVVIVVMSSISAAFLTAGVWLYSRFRPIKVFMGDDIAKQFG